MKIDTQKLLLSGLLPIIFLVFLIFQDVKIFISKHTTSDVSFFIIGLFCLLLLLTYTVWASIYSKEIVITSEEIIKNNVLGSKSMKWNEIDTYESSRYSMLIGNKNKFIIIPDYRYWAKENRIEGKKVLEKYLRKKGINSNKITIRSSLPFDKEK